eukprot:Nitzschia sp. Nitz4//scaffold156_size52432//33824//40564//NITZ4_006829-RA/size52432-processed-gene-0.30-mRNA-1//-1//CDS//3329537421//403//frame0
MTEVNIQEDDLVDPSWKLPHAFHSNLPPHHRDTDGVPLVTKYAFKKSRYILRLVESMRITEEMLLSQAGTADNDDNDGGDLEAMDLEDEDGSAHLDDQPPAHDTLVGLMRSCSRLSSQFSALENLKHNGFSQLELAKMVLHILRLVSTTYTLKDNQVILYQENMGYIHYSQTNVDSNGGDMQESDNQFQKEPDLQTLEQDLHDKRFALPSPAREVLLSLLVSILSNKGLLRSVSNAAVFTPQTASDSTFMLILHWQAFLRMLLRVAPYLDEHKVGLPPKESNSRQSTVLKRTVQLIRDARHFFDQGIRPNRADLLDDRTAITIWEMVKTDVQFHSHTHACYRSLIILYLFQPSRCSSQYYSQRLPIWFNTWSNIDRCPEMDFLWLALFCRARKHLPSDYDWGPIRRKLLTHAQYWLQLPIGGTSLDKTFPNASNPRSRSCPSRLKVFVGSSSGYEEGIDFVAKVAKLLVIGLGTGKIHDNDGMTEGTRDVLRFLNFCTPYFNPSNLGAWTFTLGAFLHYFCYELCCATGVAASMESMKSTQPDLFEALCGVEPRLRDAALPAHEVVALMNALLPLCQQALYSKNGHVGRAGEAALLYLSQMDPIRVTPSFIDFAMRALDISAVNLAHQAPAALSVLTRLFQPALRSSPNILLVRLPDILRLTLAGIDSNDHNKTIRTLILYRSLISWLPIGGDAETWKMQPPLDGRDLNDTSDGTMQMGHGLLAQLYEPTKSDAYLKALSKLPDNTLLKQDPDDVELELMLTDAVNALSDWVLEFLERIYSLLRAAGEREKTGKTSSGVATRHSSADVQQARNFSRVLKECLLQTFASMDDDVHKSAIQSVVRFMVEETLPPAAKDASLLCQAACAARIDGNGNVTSPGLKFLVPVLLGDLEHHSNQTLTYRLRCMAGAVRSCGAAIKQHKADIMRAVSFALTSKDKHVFKTGCKLLRHTLATCCESYAYACDTAPRLVHQQGETLLGRSAQLHDDPIRWHVPDSDTIGMAWELLDKEVLSKLKQVLLDARPDGDNGVTIDHQEMRRCLRAVRYALRGGAGIILDSDGLDGSIDNGDQTMEGGIPVPDEMVDISLIPYEQAMSSLVGKCDTGTREAILASRGTLSAFVIHMASLIASETFKSNATADEVTASEGEGQTTDRVYRGIGTDSKICKEICDIGLLLMTRRGAAFRSQEGKTIWKAQKQLATDFALLAEADHMTESRQRAGVYGPCTYVRFKDGEDAGKTLSRRLLVARVQLFHDSLQRTASFDVPRRLRKLTRVRKDSNQILFSTQTTVTDVTKVLSDPASTRSSTAMSFYEGIMDGLFSLCCHSNTQVRASAIGVVDYAVTRFGWILARRIPRLLAAVNLMDDQMHAKYGVPSCTNLKSVVDGQGKRKRLAEVMKGVCGILSIPRAGKLLLGNEDTRLKFLTTICGTESLVSLMPAEEMQKMVHYLHGLFSPFRLKFYSLHRATYHDRSAHQQSLDFLIDSLTAKKQDEGDEAVVAKAAHWRKQMHACWFLTVQVDEADMRIEDGANQLKLWKLCIQIIESEYGQPLQRVALGLFGRLVMMTNDHTEKKLIRDQFQSEQFCRFFGNALVYDHREDSSVGGGHDAQWAPGIADMIRDSSRNVAPRSLFPFQRTNQSSGTFKVSHAQLVESIFVAMTVEEAAVSVKYMIAFAKEMASSPPSEDQRNQQCTSAEIFAGICRAFLKVRGGEWLEKMWVNELLPFLDEVIPKIPISLSGAYFDCIRYSIQFSPPSKYLALTKWILGKIESSLWDRSWVKNNSTDPSRDEDIEQTKNGSDGFTIQSKWLYLCSALLVELDEAEVDSTMTRTPWYCENLVNKASLLDSTSYATVQETWELINGTLLPRLMEALGHPYESCRDHIAGSLFRICYCHRKMKNRTASRSPSRTSSMDTAESKEQSVSDPGAFIVQKLLELQSSTEESYRIRCNALITARRFFSYCIHFGEAKFEFADYLIPLLPLAFEALNSAVEEIGDEAEPANVAKRALEAEVVKGYRFTIAEVSVASVLSYGGDQDILRVLAVAESASKHEKWQVRHACANFLRCFQGSHKFLFNGEHAKKIITIASSFLSDERREVSSAGMAAVTGIIAALPSEVVAELVRKYAVLAGKSTTRRKKKSVSDGRMSSDTDDEDEEKLRREQRRAKTQQSSVFFLCASVMSHPYDTPSYVPKALAAISKHSFERNAPLGVRDIVKKCCAEYKRTHMSDNWDVHRKMFTQEEIEALEDVVSSPHYYA